MEDQQTTDNQTQQDGSPDNNGAGITSIMGGMAGNSEPVSKPGDGNKEEGDGKPEGNANFPAWTSQLPEDMRSNADIMKQLVKFSKIGELAKSYSELEGKLGKSLIKPSDDSSEEEKNAFYQKLGKPESADKYSIDDKEAIAFKNIAFKNNLTDEQAKSIYAAFAELGKNEIERQRNVFLSQAKQTETELRAEFGNQYDAKMKLLTKGVETYGGKSLGEKLQKTGLLADKEVVKMFINLGEQASEAGTQTKQAGSGDSYKSIAEGGFLSFGNDFK